MTLPTLCVNHRPGLQIFFSVFDTTTCEFSAPSPQRTEHSIPQASLTGEWHSSGRADQRGGLGGGVISAPPPPITSRKRSFLSVENEL